MFELIFNEQLECKFVRLRGLFKIIFTSQKGEGSKGQRVAAPLAAELQVP